MKNRNWKKKLIACGVSLVSGVTLAHAEGVDYTALQTAITGEAPGVLAVGMAVAAAAVGIMAAPRGIRFAKKMWAAITG